MSDGKLKNRFTRLEAVRVDSPIFLVSSTHHACRYETGAGNQMMPGHYLVLWPSWANQSFYGRELRYFGPFGARDIARLLETSALALGIVGRDVARPASPTPSRHRLRQRTQSSQAGAATGRKAEPGGLVSGREINDRPSAVAEFDSGKAC